MEDIDVRLKRFAPMRVVVKFVDDVPCGLVEHSFSMGTDPTRIRLFWTTTYNLLGSTQTVDGASHAAENTRLGDVVLDPLDDACPIRVDFDGWLAAKGKFDIRNPRFVIVNPEKLEELRRPARARRMRSIAAARFVQHARR